MIPDAISSFSTISGLNMRVNSTLSSSSNSSLSSLGSPRLERATSNLTLDEYRLSFEQAIKGKDAVNVEGMSNHAKRVLFSVCELIKLSVEEDKDMMAGDEGPKLIDEITAFTSTLAFNYARREKKWWTNIDNLLRFVALWQCFVVFAVFLSLPVIVLSAVDSRLTRAGVLARSHNMAPYVQRGMAQIVLFLCGIKLVTQAAQGQYWESRGGARTIVYFTHASTLDAFIICATCPVSYTVFAKKELFLLPFFGWLLFAFGGVPIDRADRQRAVRSLAVAAKQSKAGDTLLISPEGTRSPNGQLLPFKKGPFYLWENTRANIAPIVLYGAFDLFPPKQYMSHTGRVYVRYADPIMCDQVQGREDMSRRTRRRMLETLQDSPKDAGADLSSSERMVCGVSVLLSYIVGHFIWSTAADVLFASTGESSSTVLVNFTIASVVITLAIYVYAVYLAPKVVDLPAYCVCGPLSSEGGDSDPSAATGTTTGAATGGGSSSPINRGSVAMVATPTPNSEEGEDQPMLVVSKV
jgi:1-acyl-sn-glycerol-3-phosphate acyltransferase